MEDLVTSSICRLCADVKDHVFQIFDEEGYKRAIGIKINKYLQIQVDEKDSLPKNVCRECYSKLEDCSNFVNDSQNAQITLSRKIFSVYGDGNSLKGEHVFSHHAIFDQAANLLDFSDEQVEKNDEITARFECNDLNLENPSNSCYFNNMTTDCLFDRNNKSNEHIASISTEDNLNAAECHHGSLNLRKKLNKRKCVNPIRYLSSNSLQVRTKRKLCRKKKIASTRKRKTDSVNSLHDEDYSETESEAFKEKYFDQIPWMCTSCEQKFETLSELQTHHANYHLQSPQYICPHCYKVYMQYHGFVSHLKKLQCTDNFQCENCSKTFPNKKLMDLHRRLHVENPPYQCSYCDKSFKQQSGLYAHSRTHLPDHLKTEYACDQCDKCFSTKPNLVTHKKIHTGLKNYVCDLCGKSFVQKGNLSAHMLTHSDSKPFTCEICHKEFKTSMQLRKHNNIHSGKKPHQCETCGRTFRERGTLKEHYRIHTGAMPFSCEFCGKAFRFKGVLTTHRRQHTGERPYSCVECQHHFTNWPNYNKHMKRRHGINKSKANRIKIDSVVQNNSIVDGNVTHAETTDIEIPTFEDTLQPVPIDGEKTIRLFDESSTETYIMSQQQYSDSVISQQQHNSILNAFYSITAIHGVNPNQHVDVMNSSVHRDFL